MELLLTIYVVTIVMFFIGVLALFISIHNNLDNACRLIEIIERDSKSKEHKTLTKLLPFIPILNILAGLILIYFAIVCSDEKDLERFEKYMKEKNK